MEANCFGAGCSILGSWLKFNGCMLRDYGMYPKKNCFNIASRKNSDNMKNYFGISKVPIQKYFFVILIFRPIKHLKLHTKTLWHLDFNFGIIWQVWFLVLNLFQYHYLVFYFNLFLLFLADLEIHEDLLSPLLGGTYV